MTMTNAGGLLGRGRDDVMLGYWHRYVWQELWEASFDLSLNGSAHSYWLRWLGMPSFGSGCPPPTQDHPPH